MATKVATGRKQRQRTATGRSRRPDLSKYYQRRLPAVQAGAFEFELTLLRPGLQSVPLDDVTESFGWNDEEMSMSGNVALRRPEPAMKSLPVARGDRVRCRVKWAGRWYTLWTMRVTRAEPTVGPEGVSVSVDLADDLDLVRRGRRRFLRRKRKRHKHGYFGHQVLREEARREGVRLGQVAQCRHRMDKIDVTGSLLDLVVAIYEHERDKTGRRFVIRIRDGRLEVVPYRRNRVVYVLAEKMRQAVPLREPKVAKPATVLVGKAHIGKGDDARKIRHTEYRRDMVRRFGYTRREKDYGRLESESELRLRVRRDLAKQYRVDTTIEVDHEGIPFIRRGDGAQVLLEEENFAGRLSFVYCTAARHQVQGASFTSQFTFTRVDPFLKDRDRRDREAREAARKRRRGDR